MRGRVLWALLVGVCALVTLTAQRANNRALAARNAEAAAEVASLREGNEAIAERARYQLNMVREGEVLFQFVGRLEPSTSTPEVPR